jgi:hypothetical protein
VTPKSAQRLETMLTKHRCFGLSYSQITMLIQEKVFLSYYYTYYSCHYYCHYNDYIMKIMVANANNNIIIIKGGVLHK